VLHYGYFLFIFSFLFFSLPCSFLFLPLTPPFLPIPSWLFPISPSQPQAFVVPPRLNAFQPCTHTLHFSPDGFTTPQHPVHVRLPPHLHTLHYLWRGSGGGGLVLNTGTSRICASVRARRRVRVSSASRCSGRRSAVPVPSRVVLFWAILFCLFITSYGRYDRRLCSRLNARCLCSDAMFSHAHDRGRCGRKSNTFLSSQSGIAAARLRRRLCSAAAPKSMSSRGTQQHVGWLGVGICAQQSRQIFHVMLPGAEHGPPSAPRRRWGCR
jgi:hypothetical protein